VPEICRAKETSINYIVALSWDFTSFHDEDAWSNNPQIITPLAGIAVLRRKPQSTFYVSEALASLRQAYLGSFFLGPEDIMNLSIGAQRVCFRA